MKAKILIIWMLSYLLGAIVAPFFEADPTTWLLYGLVIGLCSFFLFKFKFLWAAFFGIGLVLVSISQFQYQTLHFNLINHEYAGKTSNYLGTISEMPIKIEHGNKVIIEIKTINGEAQNDKAILYMKEYPVVKFSEIIKFDGKLKSYGDSKNRLIKDRIIGEMSVDEFSITGKNKSLYYQIKGVLYSLRSAFNEALKEVLPQEESGLASGLILGEKTLISPEFTRALQNSGTSHIIALSGYNITIILSLFVAFRIHLSRRLNLLLPICFIILFIIMTGASASIVRAGIMGMMPVLAKYLGRNNNSFIAILFSATVMVLFNPFIVLYDVGFQLSFAALCGMIYLGPIISKWFTKLPEIINFTLSETLGAQVATLPLLLYYFGRASIISPISNLVILSLVPLGMLISFVIGVCYMTLPILGQLVAIPGYFILHLFYVLINFFGDLPYASTQIKIESPFWLFVSYLIILDIIYLGHKRSKRIKTQINL
ncbi:MAG: ComEC/Rec2 family competence protein [Patescibacteria group bacterium]|jgi:competence protein ComEC|nr:ComEC/Rec2 family competence protein [Patescibacteria group bacterium]